MFKALLFSRFQSLFYSMFRGSKQQKKRGPAFKLLVGLLAVYVIACFFFIFVALFSSICAPLRNAGVGWLYFAFVAMLSFALSFIGSVFATQSQLFDAKDNDLLLSMPIPPRYILAVRLLLIMALDYIYQLLIFIPAGVIYCLNFGATAAGVIIFVVLYLLLPLLTMALTCIIGWVIALITSKMRNKTIVSTVLSIAFLAAYFIVYSRASTYINQIVLYGEKIAASIKAYVFPIYHFGNAAESHDIMSLLFFFLCSAVPFAIVYIILSRTFIRITTASKTVKKVRYKKQELEARSPASALFAKELRRFFSNAYYIMNAGMGAILSLILAVVLLIKSDLINSLFVSMPLLAPYAACMAVLVLSFLNGMDLITAPSISLEGKTLWLAQSLPLRPSDILLAKIKAHIAVLTGPSILASAVLAATLGLGAASAALVVIFPVIIIILGAYVGVIMNLRFPKFDWVNEIVPIKQGVSVLLTMLVMWGVLAVPTLLFALVFRTMLSADLFMAIVAVLLLLICALMHKYIRGKGSRIFMELNS